ncbi:MAG: Crp/Fnr family transcriptional regulator [Ferruginibacter sp.]
MKDKLRILLRTFVDFNEQELDRIVDYFKPKSVKKNTILLHEGSVSREFYYIHTGVIRTYFINKNGHEKTRYVMLDNHLGTTLMSFISQKPSFEFIEALDDSELLAISFQNFYHLNKEIDNWKRFYQKILERAYSFQNRKIETLVTLTAKQRYTQLLKENPVFLQRLTNKVLASYLDMREETLSRLKSP